MLLGEARFHGRAVGAEGGDGGACGLRHEQARAVEEEQQAEEHGDFVEGDAATSVHALHRGCFGLEKQCMRPHAGEFVPHGASLGKYVACEEFSRTRRAGCKGLIRYTGQHG